MGPFDRLSRIWQDSIIATYNEKRCQLLFLNSLVWFAKNHVHFLGSWFSVSVECLAELGWKLCPRFLLWRSSSLRICLRL